MHAGTCVVVNRLGLELFLIPGGSYVTTPWGIDDGEILTFVIGMLGAGYWILDTIC